MSFATINKKHQQQQQQTEKKTIANERKLTIQDTLKKHTNCYSKYLKS